VVFILSMLSDYYISLNMDNRSEEKCIIKNSYLRKDTPMEGARYYVSNNDK
jgi:hypothetical protein